MKNVLKIALATILMMQISCREDGKGSSIENGIYSDGFIIANEGNFGTPNASVDYMSNNLVDIKNGIYQEKNQEAVGDVLQNIAFSDENAYLVVNNSNKIIVADRYTMEKKAVITDQIQSPRYMTVYNNKLYVTNNSFSTPQKYVSIYNNENSFLSKIDFSNTVERIFNFGDRVFVQHASFGTGTKYSVINPTDDTLQGTYMIPGGAEIVKSVPYEGFAYILAKGTEDSYIYKVNTAGDIIKTYTISGVSNAKNLDVEAGKIYYTVANGIYTMGLDSTTTPSTPFIEVEDNTWSTFYGFEVIGNIIFVGDAKGFTESSLVSVYSAYDGSLLKSFTAGMGVNGFYLNN